jgi:hypothetical protein
MISVVIMQILTARPSRDRPHMLIAPVAAQP